MDQVITFLQSVVGGLLTGGVYAMVGIGLSLIFGVMRIVNFAHGEYLALGMYLALWLFQVVNLDPFLAIPLIMVGVFLLGVLTNRFLLAPLSGGPEHMYILMTVGIGLIISNLLQLGFGAHPQSISTFYSTSTFEIGGVNFSVPLSISFVIAATVIIGLYWMLTHTELGRAIRATSQNAAAAELQGIDTARVRNSVYAIGVGLSAVAGTLLLPVLYVIPTVGTVFTLKAFVVTVLGGMGNVLGAIGGGLVLGVTESVGATFFSSGYRDAYGLLVFLFVLLVRPSGLFGRSRI